MSTQQRRPSVVAPGPDNLPTAKPLHHSNSNNNPTAFTKPTPTVDTLQTFVPPPGTELINSNELQSLKTQLDTLNGDRSELETANTLLTQENNNLKQQVANLAQVLHKNKHVQANRHQQQQQQSPRAVKAPKRNSLSMRDSENIAPNAAPELPSANELVLEDQLMKMKHLRDEDATELNVRKALISKVITDNHRLKATLQSSNQEYNDLVTQYEQLEQQLRYSQNMCTMLKQRVDDLQTTAAPPTSSSSSSSTQSISLSTYDQLLKEHQSLLHSYDTLVSTSQEREDLLHGELVDKNTTAVDYLEKIRTIEQQHADTLYQQQKLHNQRLIEERTILERRIAMLQKANDRSPML